MNLTEKIHTHVTLNSKCYALGVTQKGSLYGTQMSHGRGEHAPSRACVQPPTRSWPWHGNILSTKLPVPGTIPDPRSNTMKAFPAQFSGVQNQASLCHASPGPHLSKAARPCPSQAFSRGRCSISQGDDRRPGRTSHHCYPTAWSWTIRYLPFARTVTRHQSVSEVLSFFHLARWSILFPPDLGASVNTTSGLTLQSPLRRREQPNSSFQASPTPSSDFVNMT